MNNNIQESYCSFEVSKLLQEKGFDVDILTMYHTGFDSTGTIDISGIPTSIEHIKELKEYPNLIRRPTHALAIEWIRVNFGIWVYPQFQTWDNGCFTANWCLKNYDLWAFHDIGIKDGLLWKRTKFNSPQEATEAALLYVLQNLIS